MSFTNQKLRVLVIVGVQCAMFASLTPSVGAADLRFVVREGESIQAALDAAPLNSTIIVRPGIYQEALRIRTDGIKLRGRPGAIIRTPLDAETECQDVGLPVAICVVEEVSHDPVTDFLIGNGMIQDVIISGFTIENPPGVGIGIFAGENIKVLRNDISGSGCDGILTSDVNGFRLARNTVSRAVQELAFCGGISIVEGSTQGIVRHNSVSDVPGFPILLGNGNNSNIVIKRNEVTGSCGGIAVTGDPSREGPIATGNRVIANTIEANNQSCRPFAAFGLPDLVLGGYGVLVSGAEDTAVKRNVIKNNVVEEATINPGGILVEDGLGTVGVVRIVGNVITGNSVADDPIDINITAGADLARVSRNTCDVSAPDASICSG